MLNNNYYGNVTRTCLTFYHSLAIIIYRLVCETILEQTLPYPTATFKMSFHLHSDAIHRLYLFILLSLALFVAGSHTEGDVTITVTDASSNYHVTKVALSCSNGASGTQMVSFSRRGDTVDRIVANQTSDTVYAIRFDLKPENEGYYFCTIGDTRSVNEVELVGKLY